MTAAGGREQGLRLVVLGDPVAHSRSPAIHQAALDHLGIAGTYTARRVDAAGMAAAVAEVRSGELDGANVTMPHKRLAAELADERDDVVRRAGAANTLVRRGGRVGAHLTDVDGVATAWRWAELPSDGHVLVLGAGGAAAAALLALEARDLWLAARRPGAATELLRRLALTASIQPWGTPLDGAVVVNATPIGMQGEHLPGGVIEASSGLFEMAYGAHEPPSVPAARRAGLPVADGPSMLLAQAMASFEIWTGREAPEAPMRQALRAGNS